MKSLIIYHLLPLALVALGLYTPPKDLPDRAPMSIIFDSDIGPDYDDVGALSILHVMADRGEAQILATIASNRYEGIAAVLNVLNTYYGRPHIPIGVAGEGAVNMRDSQHWTDTLLNRYPHQVRSNADVPDAIEVYREILSGQPDHSVTIVSVGFLTNLAKLLKSKGDRHSPLDGMALVARKVKLLVSMAGAYPSGKEFNILKDWRSAKEALEHWPSRVIFSGFEIGERIKTGLPLVHNPEIQHSPVKDVFRICTSKSPSDAQGRMSWDETAVLVAVRGPEPFFRLHSGRIRVDKDGSNTWEDWQSGQFYLVAQSKPEEIASTIDQLMMTPPAH